MTLARSEQASRRPRSITPPSPSHHGSYARYRSRSPVARNDHYHRDYRDDYHHHHHHHHQPQYHYSGRGHHEYHHHRGYRGRGGYRGYHRGRGGEGGSRHYEQRYDHKKERFPDYLTHIPPEDDPMATRCQFYKTFFAA
jgi:hypothetical protein